jgi:arylsulfatase A-like enzyme
MLLSGAYGWHNGVFNQIHVPERMQWGMRDGTVTYAQRLSDAGYETGYVGKWHADFIKGPLDYGYRRTSFVNVSPVIAQRANQIPEDDYARIRQQYPTRLHDQRIAHWVGGDEWPVWQEFDGPMEGRAMHFRATRGIALLNEFADNPKPWLLEVHFPEPHDPFSPHVEFARRYNADDIPLPDNWREEYINKPGMNRKEAENYRELNEEDVRQAIAHYWAYNEELDHHIGRILDALEESGQKENTLVVFSSDHGELLGNHGMFIKGWMPYEETHRVPMIARLPGSIPAGSQAGQLVHLHDWAHTFCDVGRAEPLPFNDGISLSDLIQSPETTESRDAIMNAYYGGEFLYTQRILITQRYKYVFNGFDIDELYDLETDPSEMNNLIDDAGHTEIRDGLRRRLYEEMERLDDPYKSRWKYHAGRYLPHPDGPSDPHLSGL